MGMYLGIESILLPMEYCHICKSNKHQWVREPISKNDLQLVELVLRYLSQLLLILLKS